MTRRLVPLALAACALLPAAATAMPVRDAGAGDVVIGFDDLANGTAVSDQYAPLGVTFGTGPGSYASAAPTARANAAARSAPNLAGIGFTPEAGTPHSDVWMAFSTPQEHVAVFAGDPYDAGSVASRVVELDALDSAGHLLDSATATLTKGQAVTAPLRVDAGGAAIAYAEVFDKPASSTRTAGMAIDDLSFGTGGGGLALSATEGAAFSGVVAHLTGSNPGAVTIDWGDGSTTAGTVAASGAGYDVSGTHTYAEEGHDTVVVSGGAGRLAAASMTVADAPLDATGPGTIDTGGSIAGPGKVDSSATLAHFTDADPAGAVADYTATVDWGDGSAPSTATIAADRDGFHVGGAGHAYPENQDATEHRWPITVTVDDAGGAEAIAHGFASVPAAAAASTGPPPDCPPVTPGAAGTLAHLDAPTRAADGTIRQTLSFGTLHGGGAWGSQQAFTLVAHDCWAFGGYTQDVSQDVWMVRGADVEINGLTLRPLDPEDTQLVVDTGGDISSESQDGSAVYDLLVPDEHGGLRPIGRVDLGRQPWTFDNGLLGHFGPTAGGPHFGDGTVIGGDVHIPPHTDGTVVVDAALQLPGTFGSNPEGGAPPTGDLHLVLGADNAGATNAPPPGGGECTDNCVTNPNPHPNCCHATRTTLGGSLDTSGHLHLDIQDLYIGALDVKDAFLDYDPDNTPEKGGLWSGGGDLFLGPVEVNAEPPPSDQGFGFYGNGEFDYAGAEAVFPPAQIGPVSLYSIGAHIRTHPTVFRGDVKIGFASIVRVTGGVLLVFASQHEPYTYRQGDLENVDQLQRDTVKHPVTGFAVGASGQGSLDLGPLGEQPIANLYGFYTPGYFEFAGGLNLDFKIASVNIDARGTFNLDQGLYDVSVRGSGCIVGLGCLAEVSGHLSSYGLGVCSSILGPSQGFRDVWGGPNPNVHGITIFLLGCEDHMGPVTVDDVLAGRGARAAAASAHVDLTSATPAANITVRGTGGAPDVVLDGPHGEHAELGTAATDPKAGGRIVMAAMPQGDQTVIGIRDAEPGRWTVTTKPGSVPIARISHEVQLPAPRVTATVSGRGARRTLTYRIAPRPGQTVTFAERGPDAVSTLGVAHGNRGSLTFTPAFGAGGTRRIEAQVSVAGAPETVLTVARYVAPAPRRIPAPRGLRLRRSGTTVTASWRRIPGARQVLVGFRLSSGAHVTTTLPGTARRAQVTHILPGAGVRVVVTGLDVHDRLGRARATRLAEMRPPARVRGLRARRSGKTLRVSWRRTPRALRYVVRAAVRGEARPRVVITGTPRVTLARLPRGRITVRVQAIGPGGRPGPSAAVRA